MPSQYYPRFSLRELFRMGASTKRNRLGRSHSHRKPKERLSQYQYTYSPPRRSHRTYYEDAPDPSCSSSRQPYLTTLPPELQLSIFETLDPVSSTCLGLTSRKLYPMHRSRHKKVGLYEGSYDHGRPLCTLLKDWAPDDLMLDWESERLVSRERYKQIQRKREREGWRGWEGGIPVHTPRVDRGCGDWRYEDPRPRLRRQRRFERRDIWYDGRR